MYLSYTRNYGIEIHIARFHNIFGPYGTWEGGKEKAPAAMCRKVAETCDGGEIEIWGDGEQTHTFLYIDECLEGVRRLMNSNVTSPVNIGSDELISINELAKMAMTIAGKKLNFKHIPGPLGVRGRSSENTYIQQVLGWRPTTKLIDGMKLTYQWIAGEVLKRK
jgi:Nucleoside-diphosphate-sugar epimerases